MARFLILAGAGALALTLAAACSRPASAAASRGQQVFQAKCAVCHSPSRSGGPSIGPHLFGIVGRQAGTLSGYSYSSAMKHANLVWTRENLKRYIADPHKVVPGNRMPFAGLHNQAQLGALVDYLASLK